MSELLVTRRPRLVASAESREVNEGVDRAHLEFLRITEVTARISDNNTCFKETDEDGDAGLDCCATSAPITFIVAEEGGSGREEND